MSDPRLHVHLYLLVNKGGNLSRIIMLFKFNMFGSLGWFLGDLWH